MAKSAVKKEEKIITEIIAKYGHQINLKKTPYLIIEILRQYASGLPAGDDNPCGGTPPVPGPTPPGPSGEQIFSNGDLMKEILKLSRDLNTLNGKLGKSTGIK